jgi:hypothetical protein
MEQLSGLRRTRWGSLGAKAHWSTQSKYWASCGGPGELGAAGGGTACLSFSSALALLGIGGGGGGKTPNGINGTVRFFGCSSVVQLQNET